MVWIGNEWHSSVSAILSTNSSSSPSVDNLSELFKGKKIIFFIPALIIFNIHFLHGLAIT